LGGATGKWIHENLTTNNIPQIVSWTTSQTRTCTTVKDLEGGTVTEQEVKYLLDEIEKHIDSVKIVAICGTHPPGAETLYLDIANIVAKKKEKGGECMLYLDGFQKVTSLLESGAVSIYKVALYELLSLIGLDRSDYDQAAQLMKAREIMFERYPNLKWIAVTDGPNTAYLFHNISLTGSCEKSIWKYNVKQLQKEEVVNPIGAGDTVGGVMMAKFLENGDMPMAFRWGLSAATAKCKLPSAGGIFNGDDLEECLMQTEVH